MVRGFATTFFILFFLSVTSGSFSDPLPEVLLNVSEFQPSTTDAYSIYWTSLPQDFNSRHGPLTTIPKSLRKKQGHGPVSTDQERYKYNNEYRPVTVTDEPFWRHGPLPTGPLRSSFHLINAPQHDDLRPIVLRKKLGTDFDAAWMSPEKPLPEPANTSIRVTAVDAQLYNALSRLDLRLRDDQGRQLPVSSSTRRILERWLMEMSTCPVQKIWEDLGVWFWPPWVRKGVCDSSTSCSSPPGMHCVPEASRTIRILSWRCRHGNRKRKTRGREKRRRGKDEGVRCRWIKVPFPVTTGCYCSC